MKIPLTKPYWGKAEERVVVKALRTTSGSGDGPYTKKLITKLQKFTGSRFVIPVTSCTHGLELALISLRESGRLKPGDEVIVPSFTMTSTANAVLLAGFKPVFADIESNYFSLDPADVKKKITTKTRGIIYVAYAGMPGAIREIREICQKKDLFLVEDAAHAIGALYKGKALGTFSDIGVYSFHGTKNVSCGEGGAVLTNNQEFFDKMEIYRANGTNRKAFLAGTVDKYSWVGLGSSFLLSDILAAITLSQIRQISQINMKRNQIASYYTKELQRYQNIIQLPQVQKGTTPNWHIYAILFKKLDHRNIFLREMRKKGIETSYHYVPLHMSKMGHELTPGSRLPVTEYVWERLVRLPIYPGLTKKELKYIVTSAQKILKSLN